MMGQRVERMGKMIRDFSMSFTCNLKGQRFFSIGNLVLFILDYSNTKHYEYLWDVRNLYKYR